jgi:hypothetical protein
MFRHLSRVLKTFVILLPLFLFILSLNTTNTSAVQDHSHLYHDFIPPVPQAILDNASRTGLKDMVSGLPVRSVSAAPADAGQWSQVYNWPLVSVHSALMPDGKVLSFDAWEYGASPSARLWDPNTMGFTSVPNLTSGLFCAGQMMLPDGRQLVVGGHQAADTGIKHTNIFDWRTQSWKRVADMTYDRWYPSTIELPDGRGLAVGGEISLGVFATIPEVYDASKNTWTQLPSADVNVGNYPGIFVAPNGKVFLIRDEDGYSRYLDVNAETWSLIGVSSLFYTTSVMYRPGKIMMAGGVQTVGASTAVIDLNQASPAWRTTAPMAYGRFLHNLVVLPDGKVMVVGGSNVLSQTSTTGILQSEMWDPNTETWSPLTPMQTLRMYHSIALLLPDGRVLVSGGGRLAPAIDYPNAEIYSPPYLFKGARPTITNAPSSAGYASSISVDSPDASSIASVSLVRLSSVTHAFNTDQRFIPLSFSASSSTSLRVTMPANANIAPPGYYMLFILNGNGVPSVAKIVQVVNNPGSQPTPTSTPVGFVPTATPTNTPVPSNGSMTLQIWSGQNDVNEDGGVLSSDASLWVGNGGSSTGSYLALRYNNVQLPQGVKIQSAKLQFYSASNAWIALSAQIAAERTDSSPAFSISNLPSQRSLTLAQVAHNSSTQWLTNQWYNFDEIAPVIQEVVNRSGWRSGNSITVIIKGTGGAWARKFLTGFETNPALAPQLVITYGGSSNPPASTATNTPLPPASTPVNTATNTPVAPFSTPTPSNTPTNTPPPGTGGTVTFQISGGADDANEDGTSVDLSGSSVWIGNGASASYTGLRFSGVNIPRGATINSAQLQFYNTSTTWHELKLNIAGDASDNSPSFSVSRPSQRALTTQRIPHTSNVQWMANTWYTLDDAKNIVQEIVSRPGWQSGASLSIIIQGGGSSWARKFESSYENNPALAPRLVVSYSVSGSTNPPASTATNTPKAANTPTNTPSATPTNTPTSTPTPSAVPQSGTTFAVSRQIAAAGDDVNEEGTTYSVGFSPMWIGNGGSASYAGFRFTNITIPKGAIITGARLEFYSTQSQWINVSVQISGDAADNSAPFTPSSRPSQRPLTTVIVPHVSGEQWNIRSWYTFTDIAPIIQELVNRPGWQSGNSLSLVLKGTGGLWGRKFIGSFEGGPVNAVQLVITYTIP